MRKRLNNTIQLSKIKLSIIRDSNKLIKKKFKNKINSIIDTQKIRYNILKNLNSDKKDYSTITKLYDIKKKYIRYFINNRLLYKINGFKNKQNKKFYKNHFRFISSVDIKSRLSFFENSLKNWIIKFKYSYSIKTSKFFIGSGFLFLNGFQEINYNKLFSIGDFIELTHSHLTYIFKSVILNKIQKNIWIYKKHIFKKNKLQELNSNKKLQIFKICKIFFTFKSKLIKNYEIDFKTLSIIYLSNYNFKNNISYYNKKSTPLYYLKLLNWRIIS